MNVFPPYLAVFVKVPDAAPDGPTHIHQLVLYLAVFV